MLGRYDGHLQHHQQHQQSFDQRSAFTTMKRPREPTLNLRPRSRPRLEEHFCATDNMRLPAHPLMAASRHRMLHALHGRPTGAPMARQHVPSSSQPFHPAAMPPMNFNTSDMMRRGGGCVGGDVFGYRGASPYRRL